MENAFVILQKVVWSVELSDLTFRKYQDLVVVDNSTETRRMENQNIVLVSFFLLSSCLHDEPENDDRNVKVRNISRTDEQLSTRSHLIASFGHRRIEGELDTLIAPIPVLVIIIVHNLNCGRAGLDARLLFDEVGVSECGPENRIVVFTERIEIKPDCPGKEQRILRDDSNARAQVRKVHPGDVNPIEEDTTLGDVNEAEEGEREGGLATTRTTDDADLLPWLDLKRQILEYQGSVN
ncbi:hypothetical protein BC937DRAFT_90143 [Endogone sp. FLAS-F59071]|nr:hypothetical protein BC937DRAFT_90143 [Endogone sp. FLAS-F59071]|eukprot:RUS17309.1 hypothetical protein BC937DRAFT_90143 [Endogone sp. FLAS-F59071]